MWMRSIGVGLLLAAGAARANDTNVQALTGMATTASPAVTRCNGGVWLAWKGQDNDQAIYVAPSDTGGRLGNPVLSNFTVSNPFANGSVPPYYFLFAPQTKVVETVTSPAPGLKPPIKFTQLSPATNHAPAIACVRNTLYLFWRNAGNGVLYWASSPAPQTNNSPVPTNAPPHLEWSGLDPMNLFGVQSPSLASGPQPPLQMATGKSSSAPYAAVSGDTIYLAFRGDTSDSILWATFDPNANHGQWTAPLTLTTAPGPGSSTAPVTPKTSDTPAIAVVGSRVYFAWKGQSGTQLWWTQIAPVPITGPGTYGAGQPLFALGAAQAWRQEPIPNGASPAAPSLVADGHGVVWASWIPQSGLDVGQTPVLLPPIAFANIDPGKGAYGGGAWSVPALRVGTPTGLTERPAMVATTDDSTGILLAWKNAGGDQGMSIAPLRLPAQTYTFSLDMVAVINTRSGSIASHLGPFSVASSDTDYVSLAAKTSGGGDAAVTGAWGLGNLTNGHSSNPYDVGPNGIAQGGGGQIAISVPDNSQVVMTYLVNNYGEGTASQEVQLLQMASQKLVTAGASAAASAAGSALGAAIGAAIGTGTVPLLGSALGALAGWAVTTGIGDAWGVAFPGCDGPVAAGVHAFSAFDLAMITASGAPPTSTISGQNVVWPHSFTTIDPNPAPGVPPITTQSGCGSNPIYTVTWTVGAGNHLSGGRSVD